MYSEIRRIHSHIYIITITDELKRHSKPFIHIKRILREQRQPHSVYESAIVCIELVHSHAQITTDADSESDVSKHMKYAVLITRN